jgi:fatty-acyl-CoA synthase
MLDGSEPLTGSIGYVFPYYQVKILELSTDNRFVRECGVGERGIIAVAGCISPGYADERLNGDFFIQDMPDGKAWGNTGDVGSIDAAGYVWIYGRAKDLIVRGGHNIDPKLVEDVLCMHPSVQLAAAVGRPDAAKGEMPIAYVQLTQGAHTKPEELIEFFQQHCQERAAIPVEIIVVSDMPTTAVGKISKPALRRDALCRTAERVALHVLGSPGAFRVSIDEKGLRPAIVLMVSGIVGDRLTAAGALRDAFGKFEFATHIEFSD